MHFAEFLEELRYIHEPEYYDSSEAEKVYDYCMTMWSTSYTYAMKRPFVWQDEVLGKNFVPSMYRNFRVHRV